MSDGTEEEIDPYAALPGGLSKPGPGKIVALGDFKERRVVKVWEHECGAQLYFLIKGGQVMCHGCGAQLDGLVWGSEEPDDANV